MSEIPRNSLYKRTDQNYSNDLKLNIIMSVFIFLLKFRFSANVLLSLCQQSEKRPLVGVVVIGNGQSAHAVAYAGSAMQLPVLWAKGGTTSLRELYPEVCCFIFIFSCNFHKFDVIASILSDIRKCLHLYFSHPNVFFKCMIEFGNNKNKNKKIRHNFSVTRTGISASATSTISD